MFKKRNLIPLVLSIILFGCFEPSKEFFQELEIEDPTDVAISIDEFTENDTLRLSRSTDFFYSIDHSNDRYLKQLYVIANTDTIFNSSSREGYFRIDPQNLGTGLYTLQMVTEFSSASNSLADRLGAESVIVWVATNMEIDIDPPTAPNIVFAGIENGTFKIEWEPYTKFNFESYVVRKSRCGSGSQYDYCQTTYITDPMQTSWIDSALVGDNVTYTVSIEAAEQSSSTELNINESYNFNLRYTDTGDNKYLITWDKPNLYNNIESFEITAIIDGSWKNIVIEDITGTNTLSIDKPPFGSTHTVRHRITPKLVEGFYANIIDDSEELYQGTTRSEFDRIIEIENADRYFLLRHHRTFELYDRTSNQLLITKGFTQFQSEGDRWLPAGLISLAFIPSNVINQSANGKVYFSYDDHGWEIDLNTLSVESTYVYRFITGWSEGTFLSGFYFISSHADHTYVDDDRKLSFLYGDTLFHTDLATSNILIKEPVTYAESPIFASDGEYFCVDNQVMRLNIMDFDPVTNIDATNLIDVRIENAQLTAIYSDKLIQYTLPGMTISKQINFPITAINHTFDMDNNQLCIYNESSLSVIDLTTGTSIYENIISDGRYFILDNTLFSTNGYEIGFNN